MSGNANTVIMRFDDVSFKFGEKKIILKEASFSIREHTKITIMGQNGAGKSTIFKLITWDLKPQEGKIHIEKGKTIAIAKQVIPREQYEMSVKEYFATAFPEKDYKMDQKIERVMKEVDLNVPVDKKIKQLSWGQQARLLLAQAIIQEPDILLLDEPTNNLDGTWIGNLLWFLLSYEKTVVVISHDADFLNMFTDGVLYVNVMTHQVEQYRGDYHDAVEQIAAQVEKEKTLNARQERKILDAKEKINFFAQKGGKMRKLASKMREEVEEAEENKVAVRREDKTIKAFTIEFEVMLDALLTIKNIGLMDAEHNLIHKPFALEIKKGERYMLEGPNGIGKTTLLKRLFHPEDDDAIIAQGVRVGYYSQDFNALDMQMTVWDALHEVTNAATDEEVFRASAQFLLPSDILKNPIGSLSEGQKGLLCYARFVLQKPHVLILDEPTNHINFRHLPVIAQALNTYKGAIIMVCHDQGFVDQLEDFEKIDLGRLIGR
jgi:ATPase subunit of ABC transporter with duplicated ATPase domains